MLLFYSLLVIKILILVVFLLVSVAYFTLAERKILSAIQRRKGCNVVGIFGLLQPLADGLKLFSKEIIVPSSANKGLFILAPFLTFLLSILGWAVIPFNENAVFVDLNLGLIYVFAISGLSVYGIFISGWSSNSRYAFLGSLRSCSQLISYEVSIGFIVLTVATVVGSLNFSSIVLAQKDIWFCFSLFPMFILFFISMLAETNRHPFDLPEAEAELVSGYNTEYSSMAFALFFLGEYANMLLMSMFISVCFVGGWFFGGFSSSLFLSLKMAIFVVGFIWARAAFPRFRYDQLMRLGWKIFLPLSLAWLIFVSSFFLAFNWCF